MFLVTTRPGPPPHPPPGERLVVLGSVLLTAGGPPLRLLAAARPDLLVVLLAPDAPRVLTRAILDLHALPWPVIILPWTPLRRGARPSGYAAPLPNAAARRKRLLDLLVGAGLLLPALPLMALIAAIIRRDSAGPALFRQRRIGRHGRPFQMYKFRTMYHQTEEAEAHLGEAPGVPPAGGAYKLPDDPRITRVGRFLRRTSLDELPQLFNVLRGEMSLVGPRPELPAVVAGYAPWYLARLAVPPGMTGAWQVRGRSTRPLPQKIADDLEYLQHLSLSADLRILAQTIGAVLRGTGAY
ncbi:MAG TPA: sugar transferase [Chloroflexia bacterium]|nr:sugar transferase [Chloroflexia bacterium]